MLLNQDDVVRLLSPVPYLRLTSEHTATAFVQRLVIDADELHHVLVKFPHVLYEPLELHYTLARCVAATSTALVNDLCTSYSWRGVLWAAWLTCLSPDPAYAKLLERTPNRSSRASWLVDAALAEIQYRHHASPTPFLASVRCLREKLTAVPHPSVLIRAAPSIEEIERLAAQKQLVLEVYRRHGADAALLQLVGEKRPNNLVNWAR